MKKNAKLSDENGYTIIETIIAMVLLLILLFFSNEFLHFLTLNRDISEKLDAINHARNRMEQVLVTNDFQEREIKLEKKSVLNQRASRQNGLLKIEISVINSENNKLIYNLFCFVPDEKTK